MKSKPFLPSPRRRAREYAVQSLYQIQINPDILPDQAAKSVYDSIAKDKAAARSALESRDDGAAPGQGNGAVVLSILRRAGACLWRRRRCAPDRGGSARRRSRPARGRCAEARAR